MVEQTLARHTQDAQAVFRAAYENRYTWDEHFPGYTADLTVQQGAELYQGQVQVQPDYTVVVTGLEDATVQESVQKQMWDIVTHRKRNAFAKTHGQNRFAFGETDAAGAVEILVTGDAMGSHYKVRGTEIVQVSRVMGQMAFTIDHKASLDTGSGYISTRYDAIFRQPDTQAVLREMAFEDTYTAVGNYYLLTQRLVQETSQAQTITTTFTFHHHQLLG